MSLGHRWCITSCFLGSNVSRLRIHLAFFCFAFAWPATATATAAATAWPFRLLITLPRYNSRFTGGRWSEGTIIGKQIFSIVIEPTTKLIFPRGVRSHISLECTAGSWSSFLSLFI